MVTNRRKKKVRCRATRSHGYGSHKKHRGAGHRGGRGRAGTGKRGDAKKPKIWGDQKYFGKYGFTSKKDNDVETVNLKFFEDKLSTLLEKKLATEKSGVYEIDVTKLGYDKVLGYGKVTKKFKITAYSFSKEAEEKVKAAGGEAIVIGGPVAEEKTEIKEKPKKVVKDKAENKEEQPEEVKKEV